jgi:hypothetical protein
MKCIESQEKTNILVISNPD